MFAEDLAPFFDADTGFAQACVFSNGVTANCIFDNGYAEALQGAGSIKRDCTIWADYLASLGVPYVNVKPAAGATKWTAERFAKFTGWHGRTNEHGRDAALLVLGRK
jgi:hypothetical protein